MKITARKVYSVSLPDLNMNLEVEFVPVKNVPGFSHKVMIGGKKFWQGNHQRVTLKSVRFFMGEYLKAAGIKA